VSSGGAGPKRPSLFPEPGRVIGPGHAAGDFLGAPEWRVLEQRDGFVRIDAAVPARLRNPRGQLFGGFTGVYADLVALFTTRAGEPRGVWRGWLATSNMRVDYLRPVTGERILLEGRLLHRGRRSHLVEVRLLDPDGTPLAHALVTMLEADQPVDPDS
jgi:uncharacterized protein (TIGR00369 family)